MIPLANFYLTVTPRVRAPFCLALLASASSAGVRAPRFSARSLSLLVDYASPLELGFGIPEGVGSTEIQTSQNKCLSRLSARLVDRINHDLFGVGKQLLLKRADGRAIVHAGPTGRPQPR